MSKKDTTEAAPRYSMGIDEIDGKYYASKVELKGKKSRFAPGHDARLKGVLQRATRAGKKSLQVEGVDGKTRRVDVAALVAELGWEHLMAEPAEKPKRQRKPKVEVETEPVDLEDPGPDLTAMAERTMGRAKIGRATYDVTILGEVDDKYEIEYTTSSGKVNTTKVAKEKVEIGAAA